MLHQFLMALQTKILSTITLDFLKQMIILKSFNVVLYVMEIISICFLYSDLTLSLDFYGINR